jgi:DNA repair protein RadC
MNETLRYKRSTYEVRVQRLHESAGSLRINSPEDAVSYWKEKVTAAPWYDPEKEMLVVLTVNTRHVVTGHAMVSLGTLNECIAHPRDIFRPAVALGAHGILLMHNHPSGDPTPSEADRRLTRQITEGGRFLQISFLDHVIVGTGTRLESNHFSFKQAGLM